MLSARWVTSCIRGNYPCGPKPRTPIINDGKEASYYRPLVWEGNYPHRRAHHIDRWLASLLIDDDGLVATGAVGKVVSGRLFVRSYEMSCVVSMCCWWNKLVLPACRAATITIYYWCWWLQQGNDGEGDLQRIRGDNKSNMILTFYLSRNINISSTHMIRYNKHGMHIFQP